MCPCFLPLLPLLLLLLLLLPLLPLPFLLPLCLVLTRVLRSVAAVHLLPLPYCDDGGRIRDNENYRRTNQRTNKQQTSDQLLRERAPVRKGGEL